MPKSISDDIQDVLITEEQIEKRCAELALQIETDYLNKNEVPVVVGLLKGSIPFMAELIKYFKEPIEIDFMSVSSYQGTRSLGNVKIDKDMDLSARGKNVLVVEDIIDTGRTIQEVRRLLYHKGARDVKIVALLDKPDRRVADVQGDYIGFTIPDKFVVGYGLDYNQRYRNLPYIGVLNDKVYTQEEY